MLQKLGRSLKRKIAILLIACLVFGTNSFYNLSIVYATDFDSETTNQSVSMDDASNDADSTISSDETGTSVALNDEVISSDDESTTNEESISNESGEENNGSNESNKEHPDTISTDSEPKKENKVTNNIENEEDEIDRENVSTQSELDDYRCLDTFGQIAYHAEDAVALYDNIIILLKDIELEYALYIEDDVALDLSGHTIKGPADNYALYVENNFTLQNSGDIVGKIEGGNDKFPTIYLKDATAEFLGGKIYGAKGDESDFDGGDAIHSYDSNITVEGASIYGGVGFSSSDDRGGNGGDAIVVCSAKK